MKDRLSEIDDQILALAKSRCDVLAEMQGRTGAETANFGTLRGIQAAISSAGQEDFAQRLQRFVAGLTFQTAVRRTSIAYLGPEFSYSYSAAANFSEPSTA